MKSNKKNTKLSRKVYIVSALLMFFVFIVLSWLSWQEMSVKVFNDLKVKTAEINNTLTDDIDYVSYQMEFLGNQIVAGNPEDLDFIYKTLSYSRTNHKINISTTWNMFSWVDKNFQLVADGEAGIMESPKDLSIRDYIPHTVKAPWKFHLGKPVHGAVSRQWIIPGGMGYVNNKREYIGAVVFGFEIGSMVTKLENAIKDDGISFAILDNDLSVIAQSRNNKLINNESVIIEKLKDKVEKEKFGAISEQSVFLNNSSYSYYFKLDKYPFTIVTSYDQALVSSELMNKVLSKLSEFVLLSILIIALAWLLRKTIVKPITQLSNIASDVVFGKDIKSIKLPRSNSYEINNLIKSLIQVRRYVCKERRKSEKGESYTKIIRDYDKEKEEFMRDMNYVLNTPLDAIINGSDIARNKLLGDDIDSYTECFDAMYDAGVQLKCFTTEFLCPELVNVNEVIDKCVKIQRKFAIEQKSQLDYVKGADVPEIWCDKTRLKQIIVSTLYHSLFYVPANKKCSISTKVEYLADNEPVCLVIKVEDNGWGYDEKMRADDWEVRFGKEDENSISRNPDMMKLSISTIKNMVKLHHGSFDMQAKPSSGSIFTIRIPYLTKKELLVHPDDYIKPSEKESVYNKESNVVSFPR